MIVASVSVAKMSNERSQFFKRLKYFQEPRSYGNNIIARVVDERLMKVNQLKTDCSVYRTLQCTD